MLRQYVKIKSIGPKCIIIKNVGSAPARISSPADYIYFKLVYLFDVYGVDVHEVFSVTFDIIQSRQHIQYTEIVIIILHNHYYIIYFSCHYIRN